MKVNKQGQLPISTKPCSHSNSTTFIIVLDRMLKAVVYLVNNEEISVQLHDNESKIELTRETSVTFIQHRSLLFPHSL